MSLAAASNLPEPTLQRPEAVAEFGVLVEELERRGLAASAPIHSHTTSTVYTSAEKGPYVGRLGAALMRSAELSCASASCCAVCAPGDCLATL